MLAMLARANDAGPLFQILLMLVFGGICAAIASSRGRSGVGWFFIGFLFSCFALVVLLVLPDLKKDEERHRRLENENRRLREQVAKNRQVADARHAGLERRLGAHDVALGVDTATPVGAIADEPPPLPDAPAWFYAVGNERQGPVRRETIRQLLLDRVISSATLVWRDGMTDWQRLDAVPDLSKEAS